MKRILMAVVVILVSGNFVLAGAKDPPADASTLLKADQAFDAATAAQGLSGFASFLAEDVATLRPDKPIITGKDAVTALWGPLLTNQNLTIRWKALKASVSASGDLGYTVGTYEISSKNEEGTHVVGTGKYVTIWKKQGDGSWKVAFDSGVEDTLLPKTN